MSTLVNRAKWFAFEKHRGQTRRNKVTPYTFHLRAVAKRLKGECEEVIATAWLHDLLEDTKANVGDLVELRFPQTVITAVCLLTKMPWLTHDAYLEEIKRNPIARKVKIADMLSNLADDPTPKQIRKYAKGLLVLVEETP